MRKSLSVAALLLLATVTYAQKTILFKFKIMPKHTYRVDAVTNIDSKVKAVGNTKPKDPKKQSIENKGHIILSYIIQTGAPGANGNFPFLVTVSDFSSTNVINGVKKALANNPVKGARSQGYCTPDGKMHTENITFVTADESTKKAIVSMINKFGDAISFPTRPMKPGDSFTQVKPFSVQNVNMKTTVTYTLKAINGKLAYFDTRETVATDITASKGNKKASATVNGVGRGTVVYDIVNNFAVNKTDKTATKMKMETGLMHMQMDAVSSASYKAKISTN